MNFKRILVLVMALVMVVSACAPAVLGAYETSHEEHDVLDHLDTLEDLDLVEKYEEVMGLVDSVVDLIKENHEEYCAAGYAYALNNGYIDDAIDAIEYAIVTMPEIDLDGVEMSDELKSQLEAEIKAIVPTLEKLLAVLENDDLDGMVNELLGLSDEAYAHLEGAYAILRQAKFDLDDDKLPSEIWTALAYVENEMLPVVLNVAPAYVEGAVAYVAENHSDYYAIASELSCVALDVYKPFAEVFVKLDVYTAGAISETLISIPDVALMALLNNAETLDEAIVIVTEIYNVVLDQAWELNALAIETLERVDDVVLAAAVAYARAMDVLVDVFGSKENAQIALDRVLDYTMYLLEKYGILQEGIENVEAFTEMVNNDVLEIIESCGGRKDSLELVSKELVTYFVTLTVDFAKYIENLHNGAISGNYELKDDSLYVALGTSPYGEELAQMLNLSKKYFQFDLTGDYLTKITEADLITIKLDDGEFYNFASTQVAGIVAKLVRNNDRITELREHALLGEYVNGIIADLGIDLEAKAEELDWSKYIDDEKTLEMLDDTKAAVKDSLIRNGVPEYYYIDLQSLVEEAMAENGLAGLPGVTVKVDPIEVPVADLVVLAVENALYSYARFTNDLSVLLNEIEVLAPGATIAIVGIDNPLEGMEVDFTEYGVDFITFEDCVEATGAFVEAFNAQLYVRGLVDNEVLFVYENDAQAIYDALNVYCNHIYDDCEDEECNRCLAKRIAPGHTPGKFTSNKDATCTEDGTESAICKACGADVTRQDYGSALGHSLSKATCTEPKTCTRKGCNYTEGKALGHDWEKATCTEPKTCKRCSVTEGKENGHKWGEWVVLKNATLFGDGLRTHTCKVCNCVEDEVVPFVPKYSPATIIMVICSAIVFSVVLMALISRRISKKNYRK